MIKDINKNLKQSKENGLDFNKINKQFQKHKTDLDAKDHKLQQISLTVESIENNLNRCQNQGQVLSAVKEMASSFEIQFEKKLNEIKPKRNPDDDETSE